MEKFSRKQANLAVLVLGVLATVLVLLLAAVKLEVTIFGVTESESFTGLKIALGNEDDGFALSFLALVAVLLPLAGGLVALLVKNDSFISAALLIVGAVLIFLLPSFVVLSEESQAAMDLIGYKPDFKLAIGAILAALLSLIAGGLSVFKTLKLK